MQNILCNFYTKRENNWKFNVKGVKIGAATLQDCRDMASHV